MDQVESLYGNSTVSELAESVRKIMDDLRQQGHVRHGLVAMARVIQEEFTRFDIPKDIPHAREMDCIMRAVVADLEGDRSPYVRNKLTAGFTRLLGCYTPPNTVIEVNERVIM